MGITGISKSQVSDLAEPSTRRWRPSATGPSSRCLPLRLAGRLTKVREGGRIVNVAVVIATGVNADGHREILGVDLITSEDGAGWTASSAAWWPAGCPGCLVVSDAHRAWSMPCRVLPGASWQRCRVHFVRNVHTRVPKTAQSMVATLVRSIFAQPDAEQVHAQHARVVEQLARSLPRAATMLTEARPTSWPSRRSRRSTGARSGPTTPWSASTGRSAGAPTWSASSPTAAALRLVGAVLAEQHDEWAVARRYMGVESLAKARLRPIEGTSEEVNLAELADVS